MMSAQRRGEGERRRGGVISNQYSVFSGELGEGETGVTTNGEERMGRSEWVGGEEW